jgi:peroxiredoxin
MKVKISILLLITLCLVSCGKKKGTARISGTIKGLTTNVLYLYGEDDSYDHIDTIKVKNGKFDTQITVDTMSTAILLINEMAGYPIFIDKSDHIRIKGNANKLATLKVTGNDANDDFADFKKSLLNNGDLAKLTFTNDFVADNSILNQAEKFISDHPKSFASIYLIDNFFLHQQMPNYPHIKSIISGLDKKLLKATHIPQINDFINRWNCSRMGAIAPNFSLPDENGKILTRLSGELKDKYVLFAFWASWDKNRGKTAEEMNQLYKTFGSNPKFVLVGISLDSDKSEWKKAIQQDALHGMQVCDLLGFNSPIVSTYAVSSLPSYFLIAPDGVILARDMTGEILRRQITAALK